METRSEKKMNRFVQAEQCRASHVRTVSILPLSVRVDDEGAEGENEEIMWRSVKRERCCTWHAHTVASLQTFVRIDDRTARRAEIAA